MIQVATLLKHFVFFIIIIKIVYSFAYFSHIIIDNHSIFTKFFIVGANKNKSKNGNETDETNETNETAKKINVHLLYWKQVTEFIFTVCMSLLLIYHFFPDHNFIHNYKPIVVDKESKVLFLLFGFILIFSAKWTILFDEDSKFVRLIHLFH
jgi:hypothetical protein